VGIFIFFSLFIYEKSHFASKNWIFDENEA